MTIPLGDGHVPSILAAFDLGPWGRLSDGPVASGRLGSIWRLDTERGSWAVKQLGDVPDEELAELLGGAAFQEAALAAGIPTPAPRRTRAGELIACPDGARVRLHAWVELHEPIYGITSQRIAIEPPAAGGLVFVLTPNDIDVVDFDNAQLEKRTDDFLLHRGDRELRVVREK